MNRKLFFFIIFMVVCFLFIVRENPAQLQKGFKLNQPIPNPFDSTTVITFELEENSYVEIYISDRIGHSVINPTKGIKTSGRHQITFDAQGLPYGSYLFIIKVKPSKDSSIRALTYALDLFYTQGKKYLTYSNEESQKFNIAFANIHDDPPNGIKLMEEFLENFPNTIYKAPVIYMMFKGYSTIYQSPLKYSLQGADIAALRNKIKEISQYLTEVAPTAVSYHFVAQQLLACKIELPTALQNARKAIKLNKTGKFFNYKSLRQEILHTTGKIHLDLDHPKRAIKALKSSFQEGEELPRDSRYAKVFKPFLLIDMAQAYSRINQDNKAEKILSEAYVLRPSNPEIFDLIKQNHLKKYGSIEEFEIFFSKLNKRALSLESEKPLKRVNRKAIEFELPSLNGNKVKLSDFKEKVIVLNFWGYWCGSCKQEMPHLQQLWNEYRDKGLVLLAVHFDPGVYTPQESLKKLQNYVKQNGLTFPILLHEGKLASRYGGRGVPTTFLIDKNGHIQYEFFGFDSHSDFYQLISTKVKELLKE